MLPLRLRLGLMAIALLAPAACLIPPGGSDFRGTPVASEWEAEQEAAKGITAFSAELYAQLRTEKGNLIVSPYSINTALAMTAAGAQGNTRSEMEKVLHLPAGEKLAVGYRALTADVTTPPSGAKHKPELSVANSLWMQKGHPWKKEYLALARDSFHAGLFDVDFGDATGTSRRINRWVEDKTHNRIKDLVPPDALTGDTQMLLANAIYFKAKWLSSFDKKDTKPDNFTLTGKQTVKAPMMYQKGNYWLREWEDGLKVLQMPYDGEATSMYVILPFRAEDLPMLEEQLTADTLKGWLAPRGKESREEVKVWLPRFKFTVPTELAGVLQRMGINDAFTRAKANFTGMTDHPDGLFITRVIHKAFVELDEVGTEAAAATAVSMSLATAAPPLVQPRVKEFRADHPFLFVIKHEHSGAILFIGRVLDPTK